MTIPITVALLLVVLTAGVYDLRVRRIPNWLTLSGLILGFGMNALAGQGDLVKAILGLLCALAVYVPLYLVRGMGAGDVKLMAAVGCMAGPSNWIRIFLVTALLGGAAALALVAAKRRFQQTTTNLGVIVTELVHYRVPARRNEQLDIRDSRALRMPHGMVIAAACIFFLFIWRMR